MGFLAALEDLKRAGARGGGGGGMDTEGSETTSDEVSIATGESGSDQREEPCDTYVPTSPNRILLGFDQLSPFFSEPAGYRFQAVASSGL